MEKFLLSTYFDNEINQYVLKLYNLITKELCVYTCETKCDLHHLILRIIIEFDFTNILLTTDNIDNIELIGGIYNLL